MKGKRFSYPFTLVCVALIWYLCLFKPPTTDMPTFSGFDKVVHILMYLGTCGVFWYEYYLSRAHWPALRRVTTGIACPMLMSGMIELAQAYLTDYRSGDWLDLLANSAGVLIAAMCSPLIRHAVHRIHGRR